MSIVKPGSVAALLVVVAAACGTGPATTVNAGSAGDEIAETTLPTGQAIAAFDFLGVTESGELRQFTDEAWKPLAVVAGKDLTFGAASWDGDPAHEPLIAVREGKDHCNFEWRFLRDDHTLSSTVAVGTRVVLSPDGNRLAVISHSESPDIAGPCGQQTLEVLDLKNGERRSWSATFPFNGYNESGIVGQPAWSPDSVHLAYGTDNSYLFLLDTTKVEDGATIRDAELIRGHQVGLQTPVWNMGNGHLYVGVVQPDGYLWQHVRTSDGKVVASDQLPTEAAIPLRARSYDGSFPFMGHMREGKQLVSTGTPQMITIVDDGEVISQIDVPADFVDVS